MSGNIFTDNDMNVWLENFRYDDGTGFINDALVYLSIGRFLSLRTILAATQASPVVVTTDGAHDLENGDEIFVIDCVGNKAANGAHVVADKTSTTFKLSGSTGTGPLLLPTSAARYPRVFKTLADLQWQEFEYVKPGVYKSLVTASTDFLPGEDYWAVVTASNHGYQAQTKLTAIPRVLGKFV